MSLAAIDTTLFPSMSDDDLETIAEGNLVPVGLFACEIVHCSVEGKAWDAQKHNIQFADNEHFVARVGFKIDASLNEKERGREFSEFIRFFPPGNPDIIASLTEGLQKMQQMSMTRLYNIVLASQVSIDDGEGSKNFMVPVFNGALRDAIVNVKVGKKLRSDGGGKENMFTYSKYEPEAV